MSPGSGTKLGMSTITLRRYQHRHRSEEAPPSPSSRSGAGEVMASQLAYRSHTVRKLRLRKPWNHTPEAGDPHTGRRRDSNRKGQVRVCGPRSLQRKEQSQTQAAPLLSSLTPRHLPRACRKHCSHAEWELSASRSRASERPSQVAPFPSSPMGKSSERLRACTESHRRTRVDPGHLTPGPRAIPYSPSAPLG